MKPQMVTLTHRVLLADGQDNNGDISQVISALSGYS